MKDNGRGQLSKIGPGSIIQFRSRRNNESRQGDNEICGTLDWIFPTIAIVLARFLKRFDTETNSFLSIIYHAVRYLCRWHERPTGRYFASFGPWTQFDAVWNLNAAFVFTFSTEKKAQSDLSIFAIIHAPIILAGTSKVENFFIDFLWRRISHNFLERKITDSGISIIQSTESLQNSPLTNQTGIVFPAR